MIRSKLAAPWLVLSLTFGGALQAQEITREEYCGQTANVVLAIQQARLDRVKERDVSSVILASNPSWPDRYDNAIVQLTPWVYEQRMRDVRKTNLGAVWSEVCVAQWDSFKDSLN